MEHAPLGVALRDRAPEVPTILTAVPTQSRVNVVVRARRKRAVPALDRDRQIVLVYVIAPSFVDEILGGDAEVLGDAPVHVIDPAVGAGGPHLLRDRFAEEAHLLFRRLGPREGAFTLFFLSFLQRDVVAL